jgi:hypothetical protein
VKATGTVTAHGMTAGKWHGQYQFNVNLKSQTKLVSQTKMLKLRNMKSTMSTQEIATEKVANNGENLTLDAGYTYNVYLDADAYNVNANEAVLRVTYNKYAGQNDKRVEYVTKTLPLSSLQKADSKFGAYEGTYIYNFSVCPAQIDQNLVIELLENSEATEPLFTSTSSVRKLCERVINESTDAKLIELAKTLLDYGRAAQIYFKYDQSHITDSYYNNEVTTLAYTDFRTSATALNGVPFKGISFTVLATTEWNIAVREAQVITGISGVDGASASEVVLSDKSQAIKVTGVKAADFAKPFTVTTTDGSITMSGLMIVRGIVKTSDNSLYKDLARAFYLYGCAAEAYFG